MLFRYEGYDKDNRYSRQISTTLDLASTFTVPLSLLPDRFVLRSWESSKSLIQNSDLRVLTNSSWEHGCNGFEEAEVRKIPSDTEGWCASRLNGAQKVQDKADTYRISWHESLHWMISMSASPGKIAEDGSQQLFFLLTTVISIYSFVFLEK